MTLTLPPQGGDAEAATPFSYTASKLPKKAKLVVQRQMGTGKHFGTVAKVPKAPSGTGSIPALDLGRYRLRIAVRGKKHHHRKVLAQQKRKLTIYGTVSFASLLGRSQRTLTLPASSFSYVIESGNVFDDRPDTLLSVGSKQNKCRSVHVDWAVTDGSHDDTVGTTSVVQESADAVSDTGPVNGVSGFDTPVVPGQSWGINVIRANPGDGATFYINGSASCYTKRLS